jgi:hypothetical protein
MAIECVYPLVIADMAVENGPYAIEIGDKHPLIAW